MGMIWDSFIFFTVGHVFVFIACNLAVSFSGNIFSTICSLLLILFSVSFFIFFGKANYLINSNNLDNGGSEIIEVENRLDFTIPSSPFECIINLEGYEFNINSLFKTIVIRNIIFWNWFIAI